MDNTKRDLENDKGQFIRLMMKHGYTLKEAQKEYISHKQFLGHVQEMADMTGRPITIVTEIVLDPTINSNSRRKKEI